MWCPFSRVMYVGQITTDGPANRTFDVRGKEVNNTPPGTDCIREKCACWNTTMKSCGMINWT